MPGIAGVFHFNRGPRAVRPTSIYASMSGVGAGMISIMYDLHGPVETLTGQLSVAEVILNRAESGRFPSTLCGVVRQRGQFSFVRGGHIPTPPAASRDWRTAVAIAQIAIQDLADGGAPRALFFHARRVNPGWRHTRVATIGNHVFYR